MTSRSCRLTPHFRLPGKTCQVVVRPPDPGGSGRYNACVPELPEVEVLKRSLEPVLVGCQIEDLRVDRVSLRERIDRRALERRCVGREVVESFESFHSNTDTSGFGGIFVRKL